MRIAALLLFASAAFADGIPIEGKVVDEAGKPVPNAVVGAEWSLQGTEARPKQFYRTLAQGEFHGELHWLKQPMVLMAMDAERKRGALCVLGEEDLTKPVNLKLAPLVRVKATMGCELLGAELGQMTAVFKVGKSRAMLVRGILELDCQLPAGEFELEVLGFDTQPFRKTITLQSDKPLLDLGKLALDPTVIAQHWGKEPPGWKLTEARGIAADATPATFKGKWTLVVFWNATGTESVRNILPRLRDLYERHGAKRDRFEIVAIHDEKLGTLKDIDAALEKVVKGAWGGRGMPFPMAADSTGESMKAWGISQVPTVALIDPDGKLVKRGDEKMLEEKLK